MDYLFWKPDQEILRDVKAFFGVLKCIKDEPVLMGDWNSAAAKQLVIRFEMCSGRDDCKSEAFIKDWMKRKFIVTLSNEASFNKHKVRDRKVVKESVLTWYVLSP